MAKFKLFDCEFEADFTDEQVRCFNKVALETNKMFDRLKNEAGVEYSGLFPISLPFDACTPYEINVHNHVSLELRMSLVDILDVLSDEDQEALLAEKRVRQLERI